jgi:hypothetical protein
VCVNETRKYCLNVFSRRSHSGHLASVYCKGSMLKMYLPWLLLVLPLCFAADAAAQSIDPVLADATRATRIQPVAQAAAEPTAAPAMFTHHLPGARALPLPVRGDE